MNHPGDAHPGDDLLIVVGAHPDAETTDRPLAYRLRDRIRRWRLEQQLDPSEPRTCTDLWYVNDRAMLDQPVLSVGAPEVNAASAMLGSRVPTAFVVEDRFRIQLDPEFVDLRACIWGVDPAATAAGLDIFIDRYLDPFLRQAHDLPTG
jgi:hypothetical protein